MKKITLILTLFILVSMFITACNDSDATTSSPNSVPIISLSENLDILEKEAKSWQSDAYLAWVNIYIRIEYPENAQVLTAQFYSPSSESESLAVKMSLEGVITQEPVDHSIPVYQQDPITLDDWNIDTQEALDMMLDQDGLRFLKSQDEEQCSFLRLERLRYKPEQPVVWRLTLMECLGDYVRHILLDPITGEFLEND